MDDDSVSPLMAQAPDWREQLANWVAQGGVTHNALKGGEVLGSAIASGENYLRGSLTNFNDQIKAYDEAIRQARESGDNRTATQLMLSHPMVGMLGVDMKGQPLNAYHGTPHTIGPVEAPKFANEAVGSGEGAQSYGWGHYVAGNERVAKNYQNSLARGTDVTFNNKPIIGNETDIPRLAKEALLQTQNVDAALRVVDRWHQMDQHAANFDKGTFSEATNWLLDNKDKIGTVDRGNLYQVHIKPDEDSLLNLNRRIYDQPKVISKLGKMDSDTMSALAAEFPKRDPLSVLAGFDGQYTYSKLRDAAENRLQQGKPLPWFTGGDSKKAVSQYLDSLGISGLRFLDQGSRPAGEGTHNYVIFHPDNLEITHRNGQPIRPVDHNPFPEDKEPSQ